MIPSRRCIQSRFELVHCIGRGGMGEVYLAVDLETGRPAAVKVAREDVDDALGGLFEHEIQVTRRLRHPLVPAQVAHGHWGQRRFVVFEYVDGCSVAQLLDGLRRRLPQGLAVMIAIDVLETLSAVHATTTDDGLCLELVHRDVTPQNVLVDRDGRAHLIDFGVSTDRQLTGADGVVMGKPGYLAPEQLTGADVHCATDQFALGVVLWEMLTGTRLSADHIVADVVHLPRDRGVPASIVEIVERLLARQPSARFSTCADAAAALRRSTAQLTPADWRYDLAALFEESERSDCTPTVVERCRTLVVNA